MASVQVIQGPDKGRVFELMGGENVVGREDCAVELSDRTVSRQHLRLAPQDGRWMLEDLGAANGTFVNGVRVVKPTVVSGGDQIRCGSTLLVFSAGPAMIATVDLDENGQLVDAAIVATVPSSEESIVIPTLEAGAEAIDTLRYLYTFISEISTIFNVRQLLQRVLEKVFDFLTVDRGYIMLADRSNKLSLAASHIAEDSTSKDLPISQTIINEVFSKQLGVLSSNAMTDKRFASGKSVLNLGIRSAICVPIKGRDRILGVIHVDCSMANHTYSTEQLRLLTTIGVQAGLALENVRLYEQSVKAERLAAVGETVAFLSHHIKNILQALSGNIEVVHMSLDRGNPDKARQAWPLVARNLGRINDLIMNMLAFSRQREPLRENVNINHVLSECEELAAAQADQHGIALLMDMDDLPPLRADAAGLRQAFLNLINNAIEAVEEQTGAVTVTSHYDSMHRNIIVTVRDNGSGIETGKIDEIFTPFYSEKGYSGTGLGLTVAKKVVSEHSGRIDVVSGPEEGTTFTITFPTMPSETAADTAGPAAI